ncbi:hypothetical protein HNP73_004098 [Amaricoccus macauensis]|uniref:Uncharacterized protein n=1 Tax=Amaricoccus macauensis TaxID=57001 RepID=A0A840SQ22_9RHOB|nr:hypothetical protein [Amaricoccus macauensis]MBB5224137.1 hypothetical protein [Amaricoccus macauensis]
MTRTTALAIDPHADIHPERGPASAVRSAVQALFFRLGAGVAGDTTGIAKLDEARGRPSFAEHGRRDSDEARDRAAAAYRTVEGGGEPALGLALDVFGDHVHTLERRLDRHAEALKAIQLYSPDPWVRRIAQQALLDSSAPLELPSFLVDVEDHRVPLEAFRFIG